MPKVIFGIRIHLRTRVLQGHQVILRSKIFLHSPIQSNNHSLFRPPSFPDSEKRIWKESKTPQPWNSSYSYICTTTTRPANRSGSHIGSIDSSSDSNNFSSSVSKDHSWEEVVERQYSRFAIRYKFEKLFLIYQRFVKLWGFTFLSTFIDVIQ